MNPLFLLFLLVPSWCEAMTIDASDVQAALTAADLVADVRITAKQTLSDPQVHARWVAVAEIETLLKDHQGLAVSNKIEIRGIGGEYGDLGVHYSGFPRPFIGKTYRAYLNWVEDHYEIAGYDFGFRPLHQNLRTFSRNRTDGSDGGGTGPFLRWEDNFFPVLYYISFPSLDLRPDFVAAIDASFATWGSIDGVKADFYGLGCSSSETNANDGLNHIILATRTWNFGAAVIAITRNFFVSGDSPKSGVILDSDIIINDIDHNFSTDGTAGTHDVQNIVTHEIGHMLGLGHEINPSIDTEATMFATATIGETKKRDLASNDIDGIRSAYNGVTQKVGPGALSCNVRGATTSCAAIRSNQKTSYPFLFLWFTMLMFLGPLLGRLLLFR